MGLGLGLGLVSGLGLATLAKKALARVSFVEAALAEDEEMLRGMIPVHPRVCPVNDVNPPPLGLQRQAPAEDEETLRRRYSPCESCESPVCIM